MKAVIRILVLLVSMQLLVGCGETSFQKSSDEGATDFISYLNQDGSLNYKKLQEDGADVETQSLSGPGHLLEVADLEDEEILERIMLGLNKLLERAGDESVELVHPGTGETMVVNFSSRISEEIKKLQEDAEYAQNKIDKVRDASEQMASRKPPFCAEDGSVTVPADIEISDSVYDRIEKRCAGTRGGSAEQKRRIPMVDRPSFVGGDRRPPFCNEDGSVKIPEGVQVPEAILARQEQLCAGL